MRLKSSANCIEVLNEHKINYRRIDTFCVGVGPDDTPFHALCDSYRYFYGDFFSENVLYGIEGGYDLVLSFTSLTRTQDPLQFCKNLARSTTEGGYIYVSSDSVTPYGDNELRRYSLLGLSRLVVDAGIIPVRCIWETDGLGVAVLGEKVAEEEINRRTSNRIRALQE